MHRFLFLLIFFNGFGQSQNSPTKDSMSFTPKRHIIATTLDTNDTVARTYRVHLKEFGFIKNTSNNKPIILIFLGSDCPISQKYANTLRNLSKNYKETALFYGIFPQSFSKDDLTEFKETYQIDFDLVSDRANMYAKMLGASATPQSFLVDHHGNVLYQGAIDDWFYALGKNRRQVTQHYLEDALKSALQGVPIKVSYTKAIGCFIEY